MVGLCSDGTEFIFDAEDYPQVCRYKWVNHRGNIESYGQNTPRTTLARVVCPEAPKNFPIIRKIRTHDYRKSNLFCENIFEERIDCYDVTTVTGDIFQIDKEDLEKVKKYRCWT